MDWEFGDLPANRAKRLLTAPDGSVELSARSFDIFDALLSKADETVSKADLYDIVWPGQVVGENTLQVHISALRRAIPPGLILTVHGRGYKYVGPKPFATTTEFRGKAQAIDRRAALRQYEW